MLSKASHRGWVAAVALTVLMVTSCGGPGSDAPPPNADQGDISALLEKAKDEGAVVWMTSQAETMASSTANAFKSAFGIDVEFLALNTAPLRQRFQTEAESGKISADVVTLSNSGDFFKSALKQGWTESLESAKLPVMQAGAYPTKFDYGDTASIGSAPFMLWYNKDRVKEADAPKSFADLAKPKYKGLLNFADPERDDAFAMFFSVMHQKFGDEWFEGVRANKPKFYPSAASAMQAMAAGEGAIAAPAIKSVGSSLIQSGAPIKGVLPRVTTGSDIQLLLTTPSKTPHPNAGRLFANWLLSESGNKAAQGDGAGVSVYDKKGLPPGWVIPPVITPEVKDKVTALLGR